MRKFRIERAFPFMKVGEEFRLAGDSMLFKLCGVSYMYSDIEQLIEDGWISEVKQTLDEKFQSILDRERGMYNSSKAWEKGIKAELSACADKHFKAKKITEDDFKQKVFEIMLRKPEWMGLPDYMVKEVAWIAYEEMQFENKKRNPLDITH